MRAVKISVVLLACATGVFTFASAQAAETGRRDHQAWFEHMCGGTSEHEHKSEHTTERLSLTDTQKAAFKDLQDTRGKLRADRKAALCANKPDLSTFEKRLAFRQSRLEDRLAAMKAEAPKLIAFYNSLDDKQKATFDDMRKHWKQRGVSGEHEHHHQRHRYYHG